MNGNHTWDKVIIERVKQQTVYFFSAPKFVFLLEFDDSFSDGFIGFKGVVLVSRTTVKKPFYTLGLIAMNEFVSGRSRNIKRSTKFGYGVLLSSPLTDEFDFLFHFCFYFPSHDIPILIENVNIEKCKQGSFKSVKEEGLTYLIVANAQAMC